MRVFIVGGSPAARRPICFAPQAGDRVIAADLGAQHARAWGWPVHLLVGDLDSLPPEAVAEAEADGTPTLKARTDKDETDLELALAEALAAEPQEIILCAALGGRTDHLLANVLLLARPDLSDRCVLLADGPEVVRLLAGPDAAREPVRLALAGAPGDLVTLLPFGGDAVGVTTRGLRYPLRDETLIAGRTRGVSNVLTQSQAEVVLGHGMLLVIQVSTQINPAL